MRGRRLMVLAAGALLAGGLFTWKQSVSVSAAQPQAQSGADNNGSSAASAGTIRVETKLVLVDTVVTDKKGAYVSDLSAKDFRVWEDNKEQPIKSFSFEQDSAAPGKNQKRYMVLFFDNSTMNVGDQGNARKAAAQFIDANVGPNRLMALIEFGGSVHVAQNFTADADRLKQVVSGLHGSSVSPNALSE